METTKPSRREFCAHAVSFVTVASLLESCGSPTSPSSDAPLLPVINAGVANNTIALTIDASSPLAAVGSAALIQASAGVFLVARTGQDTFNAMTAVCTHQACTITGFQSDTFVCPCHGSNYNTSGSVTHGPAPSSLRRFTANFANGVLTIAL